MKQYVILLLACNYGFGISDATLTDDINDFVALFPTDSTIISDVIFSYLKNDAEVRSLIKILESSEFDSFPDSVINLEEFKAVKKFLEDAGLEVSVTINALSTILGINNLITLWSFSLPKTSEVNISGGFEGLFNDVLALFPTESIAALRREKLASSPFFNKFIDQIKSEEFQERVDAFQATSEYKKLLKLLPPQMEVYQFVNLFASIVGLGLDGVAYDSL